MTAAPLLAGCTLEDLARRSFAELEEVYLGAPEPVSVVSLNGSPKGRMLAVRYLDNGLPHSFIAAIARLGVFPWEGKSFEATADHAGQGSNRIKLLKPTLNLFTFASRIDTSAIDGRRCIVLDYDLPGNPWVVQRIRDELREVSPGLFLGPAMVKVRRGAAETILWFGIDSKPE
ncbi:hypothetical protein EV700_1083 [Fluviicoccus keumensis]|uniref:Uncharacterized protein n=1 Tax=Fluviicoccus keumensis TaxID=1435465 RepID=A0A4Q7Z853_9GAMM|nr:hypothetical protein [Fluviicoccus keumensis]RZU46702.1 hypothetical protein EV700_1083 [Fluviicoccus keumensis]